MWKASGHAGCLVRLSIRLALVHKGRIRMAGGPCCLEREGRRPAGVVLLDTSVPGDDSLGQFEDQLLGGMFEREVGFARMDAAGCLR